MTPTEFGLFSAALKTFYPKDNLLPTAQAASLWYKALQDLPYQALSASLEKWIATEKWPPSIAELRAMSTEMVQGALPEWGDAWAEVTRAVHRYGWSRPQEALDSLSPSARAAAERIGWAPICESENIETLRAQFRQVFEACARRENEQRQLPAALRETIARIGGDNGLSVFQLPGS